MLRYNKKSAKKARLFMNNLPLIRANDEIIIPKRAHKYNQFSTSSGPKKVSRFKSLSQASVGMFENLSMNVLGTFYPLRCSSTLFKNQEAGRTPWLLQSSGI